MPDDPTPKALWTRAVKEEGDGERFEGAFLGMPNQPRLIVSINNSELGPRGWRFAVHSMSDKLISVKGQGYETLLDAQLMAERASIFILEVENA